MHLFCYLSDSKYRNNQKFQLGQQLIDKQQRKIIFQVRVIYKNVVDRQYILENIKKKINQNADSYVRLISVNKINISNYRLML